MREIVLKQADSELQGNIEKNGENCDALAYAVSGNPRLLLKTVSLARSLMSGSTMSSCCQQSLLYFIVKASSRNNIYKSPLRA